MRIAVILEVKGDEKNACELVDRLLDNGFFQDAINDHDAEDIGEIHVKSAIVRPIKSNARIDTICSRFSYNWRTK